MPSLADFAATDATGVTTDLGGYRGRVVLVVNIASACGYTGQLAGLQELHEQYAERGLVVLGFPCNQFAGQEPLDDDAIPAFCQRNYGVTFPVFAKVDVNGPDAHPLFAWLRHEQRGLLGSKIRWNFTKFLVDREGRVLRRFGTSTTPQSLRPHIEKALGEGA